MLGSIALALGLVGAPQISATIAEAFQQLGGEAVFGPGCVDRTATKVIQAPARWARTPAARWRAKPVTVMAEIDGRVVTAVHLAMPMVRVRDASGCTAALTILAGSERRDRHAYWSGADLVTVQSAATVAGKSASYRSIYRASNRQCRTMLTVGS